MADVLFKKVDYTIKKLIEDIDVGEIGLPDIQRPFVWPNTKVRDLFDSMYRGYPIGYLLFWENGLPGEHRVIGTEKKQKAPNLLVVDGQQRLTSLYAVFKGRPIIRKDFSKAHIRIAFNPITATFEVSNTAIKVNPEWITDISRLWQNGNGSEDIFQFVENYLHRLTAKQYISDQQKRKIKASIAQLFKLPDYPISALELSASVPEDEVAEVFVRINSKGTTLNQANFILTLMSVFWDEGRRELEDFCLHSKEPPKDGKPSPYNHFLRPNPDQLLRVEVALGFRRARLEYVYSLLRGKDLETKQFSVEQRDKQFAILRKAQNYTLGLQNWHEFFKVLIRAGYRNQSLLSSANTILYTYAFYLIGKKEFEVIPHELRELVARWFYMSSLTGRYTDSPESRMEQDLALLRGKYNSAEFVHALNQEIQAVLTNDYWETTLPNELATASARSPAMFAFFAALCLLDARVLFSQMKVNELLDPGIKAAKSALERHHLFPRNYLRKMGIKETRDINQVANYALVEWSDNVAISDQSPVEYVPQFEARFSSEDLRQMYFWHALTDRWYEMNYADFLEERRKRIARIIRLGFEKLSANA